MARLKPCPFKENFSGGKGRGSKKNRVTACAVTRFSRGRAFLPVREVELIQPDIVRLLTIVPVQLEVDGDAVPARPLRVVIAVQVILLPVIGDGDVAQPVVPGALDFNRDVVPGVGRGGGAVDAG